MARLNAFIHTYVHSRRPLSAEAMVELQVQAAGLKSRLERLGIEHEVTEIRMREKDEVRLYTYMKHAHMPACMHACMHTYIHTYDRGRIFWRHAFNWAPHCRYQERLCVAIHMAIWQHKLMCVFHVEQENLNLQRVQEDLEAQLRKKQQEIEGLKSELTKRDNEHRSKQTELQIQLSEMECALSNKRNRIHV